MTDSMNQKIEIKDMKKAYTVYTNTDLTEGRGTQYPLHVCETKATALRLAKKAYVQGTQAPVGEVDLLLHNNAWYGPIDLKKPTREDLAHQKHLDEIAELEAQKLAVIEKARSLGLDEGDIAVLMEPIQ